MADAVWRILRCTWQRACCAYCYEPIDDGEYLLRRTDLSPEYHLACAAHEQPAAFAKVGGRAELLLGDPGTAAPRRPDLEARLVADPGDPVTRGVFADYLQQCGDPWGDVIALELAGRHDEARRVRRDKGRTILDGLPPKCFLWRGGFVQHVYLERRSESAVVAQLARVLALRAVVLAEHISIPHRLDEHMVELLARGAPARLRLLSCWLSDACGSLAIPSLEQLHLSYGPDVAVTADGLARLTEGTGVPALRHLSIQGSLNQPIPLPVDVLEALLGGALVERLERLAIGQGALGEDGAALVVSLADRIGRIPELALESPRDRLASRFPAQHAAFRRTRRAEVNEPAGLVLR